MTLVVDESNNAKGDRFLPAESDCYTRRREQGREGGMEAVEEVRKEGGGRIEDLCRSEIGVSLWAVKRYE
jgi:hypothetical protein